MVDLTYHESLIHMCIYIGIGIYTVTVSNLLCVKHYSRHSGYVSEQNKDHCPYRTSIHKKTDNKNKHDKQKYYIMYSMGYKCWGDFFRRRK